MIDKVKICINEIAVANGGRITPDEVIAHARDPSSPLHSQFNWDIKQAALDHWRNRARQLISSVRVQIQTDTRTVETVAFIRDPDAGTDQGYVGVAVLLTDADHAARAFVTEFTRAESALTRATEVADALGLEAKVERLVRRVGGLKKRVQQTFT